MAFKPTFDDKGRVLFFHYSDRLRGDTILPSYHGINTYTSDVRRVGVSYYYVAPGFREQVISGDVYVVAIPEDMVYVFNDDPMDYYPKAKKIFDKEHPKEAFDVVSQMEYITRLAVKDGYKMIVAKWGKTYRGETPLPLKYDKTLTANFRKYGMATPTQDAVFSKIKDKALNIISAVANTAAGIDSGVNDALYSNKKNFSKLITNPAIKKLLSKKLPKNEVDILYKYERKI